MKMCSRCHKTSLMMFMVVSASIVSMCLANGENKAPEFDPLEIAEPPKTIKRGHNAGNEIGKESGGASQRLPAFYESPLHELIGAMRTRNAEAAEQAEKKIIEHVREMVHSHMEPPAAAASSRNEIAAETKKKNAEEPPPPAVVPDSSSSLCEDIGHLSQWLMSNDGGMELGGDGELELTAAAAAAEKALGSGMLFNQLGPLIFSSSYMDEDLKWKKGGGGATLETRSTFNEIIARTWEDVQTNGQVACPAAVPTSSSRRGRVKRGRGGRGRVKRGRGGRGGISLNPFTLIFKLLGWILGRSKGPARITALNGQILFGLGLIIAGGVALGNQHTAHLGACLIGMGALTIIIGGATPIKLRGT